MKRERAGHVRRKLRARGKNGLVQQHRWLRTAAPAWVVTRGRQELREGVKTERQKSEKECERASDISASARPTFKAEVHRNLKARFSQATRRRRRTRILYDSLPLAHDARPCCLLRPQTRQSQTRVSALRASGGRHRAQIFQVSKNSGAALGRSVAPYGAHPRTLFRLVTLCSLCRSISACAGQTLLQ